MNKIIFLSGLLITGIAFFACNQGLTSEKKPPVAETRAIAGQVSQKLAWEVEWEKTLDEARKEGYLIVSNARAKELRDLKESHYNG